MKTGVESLKSLRRFFRLIHPEKAQLSSSRLFHMLLEIHINPGLTVDALALKVRRNRSSVHKWMLGLEQMGWVEIRRECRKNQHHTIPYITPAGMEIIDRMGASILTH